MLLKEIYELTYWTRGGLQYLDAFHLTRMERTMMSEWLQKRLEYEKKKPQAQNY